MTPGLDLHKVTVRLATHERDLNAVTIDGMRVKACTGVSFQSSADDGGISFVTITFRTDDLNLLHAAEDDE